jgi:membrane-associated phospholipid phosphatase
MTKYVRLQSFGTLHQIEFLPNLQSFFTSEITWIEALQPLRNPLLDTFFAVLNLFDRLEFFLILIPFIWFGKGWKSGLRILCILFFSLLVNHALKVWFESPRPFHLDPRLAVIQVGGFGFPSGAAQTVILLSGILARSWQSRWKWAIILPYIILISSSRVYLGVHFPSDILGGWLVGFLLFVLYHRVVPIIEILLAKMAPELILFLGQATALCYLLYDNRNSILIMGSWTMGAFLGLWLSKAWGLLTSPLEISNKTLITKGLIGVMGTLTIHLLATLLNPSWISTFVQFYMLGIWLGLGAPIVSFYYKKMS